MLAVRPRPFAYEGLYHESRLKNPKIKQGGEWMDVDWKTALEYVRSAIECIAKDGNQNQVGVWANPMNTVEELYLAKNLPTAWVLKTLQPVCANKTNVFQTALKVRNGWDKVLNLWLTTMPYW
ncbi:NADH dehydrogenase subunit G [Neisseria gonorrhoeae]|uniref:NADH dehydrogenase subunit G n=1 Tax=Neisseria gonorrhoeae TaxID=485 RepID=A0A379B126_NEIGO|nr:NADH dehydrogenase subunit G [Neisseria gonorrhoeae]